MLARLWVSVGTFKYSTSEKVTFIALNLADLLLTVFAISLGLTELNPIMRGFLSNPFQLFIAKCALPVAIAWFIPGKLLIPAILLLSLIVGWDIKELIIFFI